MRLKHDHVVITYPFAIGERNGATRNLYETALRLTQRGIRVTIVAVTRPHGADYQFSFSHHGPAPANLRIISVPPRPRLFHFDSRPVAAQVDRLLAETPADAVLGHYHEASLLPAVAARHKTSFGFISLWQSYAAGLKSKSRTLNWRQEIYTRLWNRFGIVRAHRQANVLFASSEFTKKELIEVVGVKPDRVVVNYFGMDERFLNIPRRRPEAITQILFFGRMVTVKGVVDAVEALAEIARQGNRRWQYRMRGPYSRVGHGETHAWLQGIVAEKGLADQIVVAGPADGRELLQELEMAHVGLMPSHFEAFGLSIAETQAAGLPIIAYAAGSVPEVVAHGQTGWLAPPHDVPQLSRFLAEAFANPGATFERGLAGRRRIGECFNWERNISTLLQNLAQLQS